MKASEILRKLADVIDNQEEPSQPVDQSQQPVTSTSGIEGQAQVNTVSMVAPLQQKLEIMKKAAGIDSMYDDGEEVCDVCGQNPCACEQGDDVADIKRLSGIPLIQITDEDEPFEG